MPLTGRRLPRGFYRLIKLFEWNFVTGHCGVLHNDPGVLNNVLTSDGAHFQVPCFVNKQNVRNRAPVYPRKMRERSLCSPKMTVHCEVGTFEIVSFLFSGSGENVTINDQGYIMMLQNLLPQLQALGTIILTFSKTEPQHTLLDGLWE